MGIVRKQSIQSSIFIYIGFAVGAFNLWLLPHILTTEQFGLLRVLINVCSLLAAVCALGMQPVITRFYPYFDNGKNHKNDLLSWAFLVALVGFLLAVAGTLLFKDLIIRKFEGNAGLFLDYFYLIYPFTLFMLFYGLLERVAWSRQFTVLASFLRESGVRLFTSIIVVVLALQWINFSGFITLYALQYMVVFLILAYFLFVRKKSGFVFKVSRTTRHLYKQMRTYALYVFGGGIFIMIEQHFNTILLGSHESLTTAGVFDIAFFMATLILVPKRSMQSAASATIAKAWKERDTGRIERLYKKSAATLLIAGLVIFGLIWLNLDDIFRLYKPEYRAGKYVVLLVGLANLTDLGTGLNQDILINSKIWRLNFVLNVSLIILFLVVTYLMVLHFGMMGSAYSFIISISLYNLMRFLLIWWKFNMQPFSVKTIFVLLAALVAYFVAADLLPQTTSVFLNMALRSLIFLAIFGGIVIWGKLSDDVTELLAIVKSRLH